MKKRIFKSVRTKLVFAVLFSMAVSLAAVYFLQILCSMLYRRPLFHGILSLVYRGIGLQPLFFIGSIVLFVFIFFLLTRRSILYISELSSVLKAIERGDLNARAETRTGDELGDLASSLNSMAVRLKNSIEEERKAERAKNELITSVSHDLRTPLTSVVGFLGLLMDSDRHSEEDKEKFIKITHTKALKLQNLIDELFEFTRISYGGIVIKPVLINLGELIDQLAEEFFPVLEENSMKCRLSIPDERIQIVADGDLLARLFENLMNNAVRYGKEGVYLDISIKKYEGMASVKVTNYGLPIPENDIPHIFERFYRVEHSRSRATGGTGLGLAIARNIVQLHKGEITVSSGENGTCFEVLLPLQEGKGEV